MGGGLSVRDFTTIEYMMRRGSKMLEDIYENPSTKRISLSHTVPVSYTHLRAHET